MKEISEAFEFMFKELQKTGDPYDYPNSTWAVIEDCKKAVQSLLEPLEKASARIKVLEGALFRVLEGHNVHPVTRKVLEQAYYSGIDVFEN